MYRKIKGALWYITVNGLFAAMMYYAYTGYAVWLINLSIVLTVIYFVVAVIGFISAKFLYNVSRGRYPSVNITAQRDALGKTNQIRIPLAIDMLYDFWVCSLLFVVGQFPLMAMYLVAACLGWATKKILWSSLTRMQENVDRYDQHHARLQAEVDQHRERSTWNINDGDQTGGESEPTRPMEDVDDDLFRMGITTRPSDPANEG